MDQPNQANKPTGQSQKAIQPPSNLPGVDDSQENIPNATSNQPNKSVPQAFPPEVKKEENVPERTAEKSAFASKSTEKIPQDTTLNRFGEPSDLIPKNIPPSSKQEKMEAQKKSPQDIRENMPAQKDVKTEQKTPQQKMEGDSGEYEGPSIQNLERKSLIKKVIIIVIVSIVIIIAGVLAYNKWFSKPTAEEDKPEVKEEKEEVVGSENDLDDDGMPNDWEERYNLDPENSVDAAQDPDFDKLTNVKEYEYSTDPTNPDTDKDGFKDGDEVQGGYNPNGSGKLSTSNSNSEDSFPKLKGEWQGNFSGSNYKSEEFSITLQSNGNLSGAILSEILTLEEGDMESELSGTFNYKSETSIFESEIFGNAAYKKGNKILTRGEFTLNLKGTAKNDNEISGTWTLIPDSELFWLKQDRGNFLLKKLAEF